MEGLLDLVLATYCPGVGQMPAMVVVFDRELTVLYPPATEGLPIGALTEAARRVIDTGIAEADVVGTGLAASCTPMHADDTIIGVICIVEDPVLATAARELVTLSHIPMAIFDERRIERYANRAWQGLATAPLSLTLPTLLAQVIETGERHTIGRASARPFQTLAGTFRGVLVTFDVGDAALADAELASTQKDRFIATLSHELRAPLAAMLLWEKVLRDESIDAATRTKALDAIHESASAQSTLVGDLLDISRAMTGKLHIDRHPVALDELLETVIANVRPLAGQRVLEADLRDARTHVHGDANRLRQIFTNLITNAIKCTEPSDRIFVRGSRTASTIEISVEDSGRGIAPEALQSLFEPFRQAAPKSDGGLGLGLAIASQLVLLHGGQITAASPGLGQGATFRVSLPITTIPRTVAASTKSSRLGGVRVLVVDDDRRVLDALRLLLERAGATVETAKSADDGIGAVERITPDVVLSDLAMPDGDGCAMMRTIRARETGARRVPAVAMTAHVADGSQRDAIAAGFDRYLTKPIDIDQLISTLARLVPSATSGH